MWRKKSIIKYNAFLPAKLVQRKDNKASGFILYQNTVNSSLEKQQGDIIQCNVMYIQISTPCIKCDVQLTPALLGLEFQRLAQECIHPFGDVKGSII